MMVHLTKKQSVKTLPMGYKQTEVGVIPEDWVVCTFGSLVNYRKGFAFKSNDYQPSGTRVIRVSDTSFCSIEDNEPVYVSNKVAQKHTSWAIKKNDLIFSTVGSKPPMYDSLVGKAILVTERHSGCLLNQNAVRIRSKSVVIGFQVLLLNHFRTNRYIDFIEVIYRGNANQASITLENLFEYKIPLPALAVEQTAIANVLSDTDALITELEQLITKKHAIKTATMQQLLTGRTRLPQFSKYPNGTLKGYATGELGHIPVDWEVVTCGEIGKFRGGSGFPTGVQGQTSGKYPFYKVSDMNNYGNGIFMSDSNNWISSNIRKQLGSTIFPAGSIIFAKVGAAIFLERKKILTIPSCIDNNLAAFELDLTRCEIRFIHYILLNLNFGDYVSTTALPSLSGAVLSKIKIVLPSIKEQLAIASILSDMDAEIEMLEKKLAKFHDIKQGMMQQLLTGRIRLPLEQQQ
ncbi:restriction endonuclease subunit S [Serratia proteamaculans]|uniref:restriction endonuclease subunit S n=1 Tax=Serratia proteamaculans TaxID=28151 RepID=UPI003CF56AE0